MVFINDDLLVCIHPWSCSFQKTQLVPVCFYTPVWHGIFSREHGWSGSRRKGWHSGLSETGVLCEIIQLVGCKILLEKQETGREVLERQKVGEREKDQ